MRSYFFGGLAIVVAAVLFTSCLKNDNNGPDLPSAGLMSFNLAPDQSAVVVRLSGSAVTAQPLNYTSFTGFYQQIYTGSRDVQSFDQRTGASLANSQPFNFEANKSYSVFVVGSDSSYKNVVSVDSVDDAKVAAGKAYIRYINGITDTVNNAEVTVTVGGTEVVNDNAAFASINEFTPVDAGDVTIAVKNAISAVDINRTVALQAGKAYTFLLIGVPGDASEEKKPQIKYVENGTVTVDEEQ